MKSIFVISDLHLGGKPGFQICSSESCQKLADFVDWVKGHIKPTQEIHLVLAGDIVDFLAEEPWQAFTNSKQAIEKLQRIIGRTKIFWEKLKNFADNGGKLTLMLGNHDIELCLPEVRNKLLLELGENVNFIYDDPFTIDNLVLIEHGNRYDKSNVAAPYSSLRELEKDISNNNGVNNFCGILGSQFVIEVMNELKEEYKFVDLLKPEFTGAIPLIAVIKPAAAKKLIDLAAKLLEDKLSEVGTALVSISGEYMASEEDDFKEIKKDIRIARKVLGLDEESAGFFTEGITEVGKRIQEGFDKLVEMSKQGNINVTEALKDGAIKIAVDKFYQGLKRVIERHKFAFSIEKEEAKYLVGARKLAEKGYQVIVFGHTHLAKKISLNKNNPYSMYLNSGTWADLMCFPESMFDNDETIAKEDLVNFIAELKLNKLEGKRIAFTTFIQINLDNSQIKEANVLLFRNNDAPIHIENFPNGIRDYATTT